MMKIGPSKGFMGKAFGKTSDEGSRLMGDFKKAKKRIDIKPRRPGGIFNRAMKPLK